jgi:hypothetical protein
LTESDSFSTVEDNALHIFEDAGATTAERMYRAAHKSPDAALRYLTPVKIATRRLQTARRNSGGYRLGMDYLLVAHDQTLTKDGSDNGI